jgi:hypothetical protein
MKRIVVLFGLSILIAVLSGCVTPHAYVDPQYQKASFDSIQRPAQPAPVKVEVHFERNGAAYAKVDKTLQADVEQSLKKIGVFVPTMDASAGTITVTANNIADTSGAAAKGFKVGLTFGAAGQVVDDDYEFVCVYQAGGADKSFTYHHAIHTSFGNVAAPVAGVAPMTLKDAFSKVVEDVMVNFVKDLQDAGVAPKQ